MELTKAEADALAKLRATHLSDTPASVDASGKAPDEHSAAKRGKP